MVKLYEFFLAKPVVGVLSVRGYPPLTTPWSKALLALHCEEAQKWGVEMHGVLTVAVLTQ